MSYSAKSPYIENKVNRIYGESGKIIINGKSNQLLRGIMQIMVLIQDYFV